MEEIFLYREDIKFLIMRVKIGHKEEGTYSKMH
jgi:hypothetical protein